MDGADEFLQLMALCSTIMKQICSPDKWKITDVLTSCEKCYNHHGDKLVGIGHTLW